MCVSSALLCACDCVEVSLEQAKHDAEVVFRGTVVGYARSSNKEPVVVFRVSRVWKGRLTDKFEMLGYSGDFCQSFPPAWLAIGNELLVFASRLDAHFEFTPLQCATKLLADVKDIGKLGAGRIPILKQPSTTH